MRLRHVCLCHPPSQSVLVTLAFQRYFDGEKRKLCKTFFLWFQLPLIYYSLWHFKIFLRLSFLSFLLYKWGGFHPRLRRWFDLCVLPTVPQLLLFVCLLPLMLFSICWLLDCNAHVRRRKKSARNSIADLISIANHEHTCALSSATLTLESGKSWLFEHVCQAACLAVWRMWI